MELIVNIILLIVIIPIIICLVLIDAWFLLLIWNWFCGSADINLSVPINWGTVISLKMIILLLKLIFSQ
ncbi:hypothetical protein ACNRO8_001511 [Proteus mirabilis]